MLLAGEQAFKTYISKEINSINSNLSPEIKNYLTELLYFYLISERLFECKTEGGRSYESTLVDIYQKTHQADSQEKIYLFKKMGDLSLYISGFFREALAARIVHISYYEDMGQSAYAYIADCYKNRDNNVFSSLSEQFKFLSELLFHIQQNSEAKAEENHFPLFQKRNDSC